MPNIRSPAYPRRLRATLAKETANKEFQWEYDELASFLAAWRNMGENTIAQRLRDLTRMATHPVVPVRLQGAATQIVESFYRFYKYRLEVEQKAGTAIANDFKAIKAVGSFLGIPDNAWPTRPPVARKKRLRLPTPEDVYALLHADYLPNVKRSYENALVRYLLAFDFGVGWRFPSEPHAARVGDLEPEFHTLTVREPKKTFSERELYLEPEWMCCARNRLSLSGFLAWRAKVDVGGTEALFLKPSGEPFRSRADLSKWLSDRVKPLFPWFHGYLGRRWCVNARLIEWDFDYERVANWTGHESVDMVRRTYEHDARLHAKMYGSRWLDRAFVKSAKASEASPAGGR